MSRQYLFESAAKDDLWDQWRWETLPKVVNPSSLRGLPEFVARVFGQVRQFLSIHLFRP
jgi:hypothetical protein